MDFFEKFAREHGLRLLQPLGGKPETIWLAQTAEGEKRVLRRYAGRDTVCRKLVGVQTPQLAQVYACQDADEDTVSEEEYIDGTLLSDLLRRTLLDERQAAAAARELCAALQTLHGLGYVHRDVKPENVMLTKQGRVVLLDLDAAAPLLGSPDRNTRLLGTAGYAAPEQFGFARCDVRADIFALGVLLNVMLTGEHPSVCLAKGRLGRIVRRCTHTNAAQRYETVDALLRQLPKAGPAHLCALCGGVTPGGGCVWCGGAAKRKAGQKLGWALAAAIAGLALAVGGYAIGLQNPTAAMARPAQATGAAAGSRTGPRRGGDVPAVDAGGGRGLAGRGHPVYGPLLLRSGRRRGGRAVLLRRGRHLAGRGRDPGLAARQARLCPG